jgi:hypothetical protein
MDMHERCSTKLRTISKQEGVGRQMRAAWLRAGVAVLDFCGKIMLVHKHFPGAEIYIVYNVSECKEDINSVVEANGCVYVLEDVECFKDNFVYKGFPGHAIFLLFDKSRLVGQEIGLTVRNKQT